MLLKHMPFVFEFPGSFVYGVVLTSNTGLVQSMIFWIQQIMNKASACVNLSARSLVPS